MAKYPTPFHHPREAMVLEGIGEVIAKKIEDRLARYCEEEGIPMPGNLPCPCTYIRLRSNLFFSFLGTSNNNI